MTQKKPPKKVVSERGLSDYEGKIADDAEIIDAVLVDEDEVVDQEPPPPVSDDPDRARCLYCEHLIHLEPRVDRFGLKCPGEGPLSTPKKVQKYLLMREFCEDQEKIDNLDVDKLTAEAEEAYRGRKRSGVTHAELQADIDMRLARLQPKMKLRENLPSDGPDIEIPHITVPGRAPKRGGSILVGNAENLIGGKRPTKILTQKQQAADRAKNSRIAHVNEMPTMDQMPNASEVPPERQHQEYDQMIFINKDMPQ